ncbi:MAG: nucleotidyltransferase family protein [Chthonomonadales bacterium]
MAPAGESASPIDAVILAGGRAQEDMAHLTGTRVRALFPFRGRAFAQWAYEALRAVPSVGRIAIVGPVEDLKRLPDLSSADLLVPERDSMEANLFAAVAALLPQGRLLATACDNPLLSAEAYCDFLARCPMEAALCYPIMEYKVFLAEFPGAANIPVRLRDGVFIGGDCVLFHSAAIPKLQRAICEVAAARKSLHRMVGLLGWRFALRFAMRLATSYEVEARASQIAGVTVRFVRECHPAFAIDIDDPTDWNYLMRWDALRRSSD